MKRFIVDIKEYRAIDISPTLANANKPKITRTPAKFIVEEKDLDKWKLLISANSIIDYSIDEIANSINVVKNEKEKKAPVVTTVPARPSRNK